MAEMRREARSRLSCKKDLKLEWEMSNFQRRKEKEKIS